MQHANRGGGRILFVDQAHRSASNANDGSESKPWLTIQHAANLARPGDTVLVKAGVYAPFKINNSGTPDARIVFAAHPGDEHRAIIDGGGAAVRGLIESRGQSHITIEGFRLQNARTDGIFVEGIKSGARDIQIVGNQVDTTGNSGIYAAGLVMGQTIGVNEYRLFDVLIHGNEVTNTNWPTGRNEAITLGGGIDGFVVSHNWVHHSRQYGIDAKLGAINGKIHDNLVHHIAKHAIYLDSAARTVANIEIFNNTLHNNNNGIALARESDRTPKAPNIANIEIRDNLIHDNNKYGVMLYKHSWDVGTGQFHNVKIHSNSIAKNGSDGIHLVGIGDFATKISVTGNTLFGNGRDINNRIGAQELGNTTHLDPSKLGLGDGARAPSDPAPKPVAKAPEKAPEKPPLQLIESDKAPETAPKPVPEPKSGPSPAPAPPIGEPIVAINIGSSTGFTAADGTRFAADDTGVGRAFFRKDAIAGTRDDALYWSEAWSGGGLSYAFAVADGTYRVDLHFAEIWSGAWRDGARVFDVAIEGRRVLDKFDIHAEAGAKAAVVQSFEVKVRDGVLNIELAKGVENPKLNALAIFEAAPSAPAPAPAPTPAPANDLLGAFTLWDARRDVAISAMGERTVVHEAVLRGLDPAVTVDLAPGMASVRLALDGRAPKIESVAPYALFGDDRGDLRGGDWNLGKGPSEVTAEYFASTGARGTTLGRDVISVEAGGARMAGAKSVADVFVINERAMGAVRIEGFEAHDRVSLIGGTSAAKLAQGLGARGGDAVLDLGDGHVLTIADWAGVGLSDLIL